MIRDEFVSPENIHSTKFHLYRRTTWWSHSSARHAHLLLLTLHGNEKQLLRGKGLFVVLHISSFPTGDKHFKDVK